jgi:hypothetical protein
MTGIVKHRAWADTDGPLNLDRRDDGVRHQLNSDAGYGVPVGRARCLLHHIRPLPWTELTGLVAIS